MNQKTNLTLLNHFEKFAFNPSFQINIDELEGRYIKFQKQFHPDSLTNKNTAEQIKSIANSITINEAYEILKDPLKRAAYLLKLNDIDINDDHCHIKPDPQTLMLVMEIKEQLFAGDDIKSADEIKNSVRQQIKQLMQEAELIFANKNYPLAAQKLIEVKYLNKILIDIKLKKQKLNDSIT